MNAKRGFTIVELMIVVFTIGLLATIAVPSYVKAREKSQGNVCINTLRVIDHAKELSGLDNRKMDGASMSEAEINPYMKKSFSDYVCPGSGSYTIQPLGTPPDCSVGGPHALEGS